MIDDPMNNPQDGKDDDLHILGIDTQEDAEKDTRTSVTPFSGKENLGQQDAVGGTESSPETDDDVDAMRGRMGLSGDMPDEEPKEMDTGKEIDDAEEFKKDH